jgi:hypothetical protein
MIPVDQWIIKAIFSGVQNLPAKTRSHSFSRSLRSITITNSPRAKDSIALDISQLDTSFMRDSENFSHSAVDRSSSAISYLSADAA